MSTMCHNVDLFSPRALARCDGWHHTGWLRMVANEVPGVERWYSSPWKSSPLCGPVAVTTCQYAETERCAGLARRAS